MCAYSLHNVASRPARVGDKLVSTKFKNSITRGLAAVEEPDVAVCLLPGTEVAFGREVEYEGGWRPIPALADEPATEVPVKSSVPKARCGDDDRARKSAVQTAARAAGPEPTVGKTS